jgi:hypothetical protein
MAYPLHNAINSVDDLATTVRNNAQALFDEMVAVHKYFTGLETRAEGLEERVADLLTQSQSLESTHKELQDQLGTSLVNGIEKDEQITILTEQITNLERTLINGTCSRSHLQKSPAHPDPDVFTGDNRTLLENFLSDLRIKLNMNEDWWATEQKRMGYVLSRLGGKAKAQFASKVDAEGTINFANVKEMLNLLCIAFGIGDEKEASQKKLRQLKQGQRALTDFLPEWVAIANKTGFNDIALISQLKVSLHHAILVRLSFIPRDEVATTLDEFLTQVRATDSTLSALDSAYTKTGSSTTPSAQAALGALKSAPTTSDGGDAMDLSMLWTKKNVGTKPQGQEQREARKAYNRANGLYLWCDSPKHFATVCPTAPWNKGKHLKEDEQEKA